MTDEAFTPAREELIGAVKLLFDSAGGNGKEDCVQPLPRSLPEQGMDPAKTLALVAPHIIGGAARLGAPTSFAHMDPPTHWVSWAITLWNAALNQNLLHPDTAPVAREIEKRAIDWLAPFFSMDGGHMTSGSTLANLTAIWAARELCGVRRVVASQASHLSIAKAAHLLGLEYIPVPTDAAGALDPAHIPGDREGTCLVLTAGTTSVGAMDPLSLDYDVPWLHIDAAWAGPLRLTNRYASRLDGIERADSVSISAHKLLFQPKESALVLFRDVERAHAALRFGGTYLAAPNIGLLGSHGAVAAPLLGTLLALGRCGLSDRIEFVMHCAEILAERLQKHPNAELFAPPQAGILLWRPYPSGDIAAFRDSLPDGLASITSLGGKNWLRNVAANPNIDVEKVWNVIAGAPSFSLIGAFILFDRDWPPPRCRRQCGFRYLISAFSRPRNIECFYVKEILYIPHSV